MENAKLTYFAGRGLVEVIRLLLTSAGLKWTEEHLKDPDRVAELRKDKADLFGQFPILEINGLKLVQSMAIARYLANKYGFMGNTEEENVRIDILTEGARDWYVLGFGGLNWLPVEKRPEKKQELLEKSKTRYFPAFEKVLKDNGSNGFLVGNKLTLADLQLFDVLTWVWELDAPVFDGFPVVKAFYEKLSSWPPMLTYLQSPQRFPPPDDAYIKDVKCALSW